MLYNGLESGSWIHQFQPGFHKFTTPPFEAGVVGWINFILVSELSDHNMDYEEKIIAYIYMFLHERSNFGRIYIYIAEWDMALYREDC